MLYECPECGCINDSIKWNIETRKFYGEKITEIQDDEAKQCYFVCPCCNTESIFKDIRELEESSKLRNKNKVREDMLSLLQC